MRRRMLRLSTLVFVSCWNTSSWWFKTSRVPRGISKVSDPLGEMVLCVVVCGRWCATMLHNVESKIKVDDCGCLILSFSLLHVWGHGIHVYIGACGRKGARSGESDCYTSASVNGFGEVVSSRADTSVRRCTSIWSSALPVMSKWVKFVSSSNACDEAVTGDRP